MNWQCVSQTGPKLTHGIRGSSSDERRAGRRRATSHQQLEAGHHPPSTVANATTTIGDKRNGGRSTHCLRRAKVISIPGLISFGPFRKKRRSNPKNRHKTKVAQLQLIIPIWQVKPHHRGASGSSQGSLLQVLGNKRCLLELKLLECWALRHQCLCDEYRLSHGFSYLIDWQTHCHRPTSLCLMMSISIPIPTTE